jgi:hypothetical protein
VLEDELSIFQGASDGLTLRSSCQVSLTYLETFSSLIGAFTSSLNQVLSFLSSSLRKPLFDSYFQFQAQVSLILDSLDRFVIYLTWFRDVSERYHRRTISSPLSFPFSPRSVLVDDPSFPPLVSLSSAPSSSSFEETLRSHQRVIQQQRFCLFTLRLLIRSYKTDISQLLSIFSSHTALTTAPSPPGSSSPTPTPGPPRLGKTSNDDLLAKTMQMVAHSETLSRDLSQCLHQQIDNLLPTKCRPDFC